MSTPAPDRSSYLRFLPAIYSGPDSSFLAHYLKIFEKILTGIDDGTLDGQRGIQELLAAKVVGNLFYPRFSFLFDPADTAFIPPISGAPPEQKKAILTDLDRYIGVPTPANPTASFMGSPRAAATPTSAVEDWLNGFLNWLSGWVDLTPDNAWSIDKKRTVLAQALALYRMRGTPQGLGFVVNLIFDLPLTITGITYQAPVGGQPAGTAPIKGQVTVTVSNPAPPGITVNDDPAKTFVVRDQYVSGDPVVSAYFPWLFNVLITLPNAADANFVLTQGNVQQILQLRQQIEQLLMNIKPAGTHFDIDIVPSLQLQAPTPATQQCNAATLGRNTLLGLPGKTSKKSSTETTQ
ncbi:phage tail protein [Trinickia sp. YCB016]